ncbi:MAG TPA: hypothetical protein VIM65_18230 [Cyclobacteriaceae bacterium]
MKFFYSSRYLLVLSFALLALCSGNVLAQKKADQASDLSADSNFTEATNFMFQGLVDQSILSFTAAANGFQESGNVRQIIACYMGIATCYMLKGDFGKSQEFNEKAFALHKDKVTDDPEGLDLIINNLALCKEAQRQNNGAIKTN